MDKCKTMGDRIIGKKRKVIFHQKISIYRKILLIFLAVIVPVFILSLFLNKMGEKKVSEEVSRIFSSEVEFCINSIEKEVDRMETFMNYYVVNESLLDLSGRYEILDNYEKSYAIRKIHKDFRIFVNTTLYFDRINLYISEINREITSDDFEYYVPEPGEIDKLFECLRSVNRHGNITPTEKGLVIMPPFGFNPRAADTPPFIFFYSLMSNDKLAALLENRFGADYTGAVIANGDFSWFIHSDKNEHANSVLDKIMNDKIDYGKGATAFLKVDNVKYMLFRGNSEKLGISIVVYVDRGYFTSYTKPFQMWFWVMLSGAFIVIASFSLWLFRLVYKPFHRLISSFDLIEDGVVDIVVRDPGDDEFKYLYSKVNSLIKKYKELVQDYFMEKYRSQQNELKFLQSQIKPHFFYNSHFALQNLLIMQDYENGIRLSRYLGNYFDAITRNSQDCTTLENEYMHMVNYTEIQKFRYGERIEVQYFQIPDEYRELEVPRLILQPVVENCFEHGFKDKAEGGLISVEFSECNGTIVISVIDNGKGFDEQYIEYMRRVFSGQENTDNITGLININRRLMLKYGPGSGLRVQNNDGPGTRVDIVIKVNGKQEVKEPSEIRHSG